MKKIYRRLPGRKRQFLGYYTIWLGPDHLLANDSKQFSEDYKRFYYKDIQAVIIRKTISGKIQNLILGIICALFILFALLTGQFANITLWILAGLFFIILLINWFYGPTCICHLQTAVQSERLPSLYRLKTAKRAINRLRPLIEEAQGVLTPDMIRAESLNEPSSVSANKGTIIQARHEYGTYHTILFILLLLGGLFTVIDLIYNDVALTILTTTFSMAIAAFVVIALVRQHDSDITGGLRALTWTSLVYIIVDFVIGIIITMVISIKNPEVMRNQWEIFQKFSELSPLESPWLMSVYIFSISCPSILGISGLLLLMKSRREYRLSFATHTATHATPSIP